MLGLSGWLIRTPAAPQSVGSVPPRSWVDLWSAGIQWNLLIMDTLRISDLFIVQRLSLLRR